MNATDTEPGDVKWENLHVSFLDRLLGRMQFVFIVFICMILCVIIIIGIESFLKSLDAPENCFSTLNV